MDLAWQREKFLEELDQDTELAQELVTLFLSSAKEQIKAMEEALSYRDIALLRKKAHSLKGAAGTIYLEGIRETALLLEKEAQDLEKAALLLERIKKFYKEFVRESKDWLSG